MTKRILTLSAAILFLNPLKTLAQSDGFEVVKNLELISEITKELDKFFVDQPIPGRLMKTAIDAMLMELDPYTVLIDESTIEDVRIQNTGQLGTLGLNLSDIKNKVCVVQIAEGQAAQLAGIKVGDIISEVDGQSMVGKNASQILGLINGPKGTSVAITVDRPFSGKRQFNLERSEQEMSDVPHYTMVNSSMGYIKLTSFSQTAYAQVLEAYEALEKEGMKSLIFDLRGNGGGVLTEAVRIVNLFVPKGQEVVRMKGRSEGTNIIYNALIEPKNLDIPVAVLVDATSASASEIVAGALQDLDRAVIIGRNTFGKGLVQRVLDLKYGTKLKLTIARYYTPSGRCVQRLDYSNRKEGEKATSFGDEQIVYFKTKNGRQVRDSRGVDPDVEVEDQPLSTLTQALLVEYVIFDFATLYASEIENLVEPATFSVSDATYDQFCSFVKDRGLMYQTESEISLEAFLVQAKSEGLLDEKNAVYQQLKQLVTASLSRDLIKYKPEIKKLLEEEIVSRYSFEKGKLQYSFSHDPDFLEAINILGNASRYKKILAGK